MVDDAQIQFGLFILGSFAFRDAVAHIAFPQIRHGADIRRRILLRPQHDHFLVQVLLVDFADHVNIHPPEQALRRFEEIGVVMISGDDDDLAAARFVQILQEIIIQVLRIIGRRSVVEYVAGKQRSFDLFRFDFFDQEMKYFFKFLMPPLIVQRAAQMDVSDVQDLHAFCFPVMLFSIINTISI